MALHVLGVFIGLSFIESSFIPVNTSGSSSVVVFILNILTHWPAGLLPPRFTPLRVSSPILAVFPIFGHGFKVFVLDVPFGDEQAGWGSAVVAEFLPAWDFGFWETGKRLATKRWPTLTL